MEKLSALCSMSSETDLDQLIKSLDPDEFIVENIKREKGGQGKRQRRCLFHNEGEKSLTNSRMVLVMIDFITN